MKKADDIKFNAFHRHAIRYIIGIHPDKESQGSSNFDKTLVKIAEEHNFDYRHMSLDDIETKTPDFMHSLSEKEMMKLLKYFIPVQEFNYFL